ncbi:hypothetical protein Taro_007627 [Colocasia esculenta]|uniref:50S ribosomal protein L19, chloroplastic n=1 Tax=Colocasia esculenta TaxID=4460 RepID=A0A843U0V3_COLES|nr:hypothetical protein [Colocasia esculenta]
MASRLLPSHALPRHPATTTTMALSAPPMRLSLPAFSSLTSSSSSSSLLSSNFLSSATAAATRAVAGCRRSGVLPVVRATEGEEAAETADVEEAEAGLSEEEGEGDGEEEVKPPRKPVVKLGDIMGILHKRAIEASEKERPVPDIRTGDIVEIKLEVPENRRRASIYKGIVMSKQNAGIHTTIRIRRIVAGIGVEIVFPVHSPNIKEIKVVNHRKVRRARLYYLRDKLPRLSTFK